jgi:hypothetical protein
MVLIGLAIGAWLGGFLPTAGAVVVTAGSVAIVAGLLVWIVR